MEWIQRTTSSIARRSRGAGRQRTLWRARLPLGGWPSIKRIAGCTLLIVDKRCRRRARPLKSGRQSYCGGIGERPFVRACPAFSQAPVVPWGELAGTISIEGKTPAPCRRSSGDTHDASGGSPSRASRWTLATASDLESPYYPRIRLKHSRSSGRLSAKSQAGSIQKPGTASLRNTVPGSGVTS